jgi:hypothetical protein
MTVRPQRYVLRVTNPDGLTWLQILANEQRNFLFDDDGNVIEL